MEDLLHQPDALENTLEAFQGLPDKSFSSYREGLRSGALRRIILTGMGSSYYALHALWVGLIAGGLPAQMIETSELVHHGQPLLANDSLVVAVSQSGGSAEVLQLMDRLPRNAKVIAVTNTSNTPLTHRADSVLLTRAGNESTVSCKTYVTALAALGLLETLLNGKDGADRMSQLRKAPKAVYEYLLGLDSFVNAFEQLLKEITYLILTGRGGSLAAVGTGGLIIKEAAHFPTEGMSSAAFRHGPLELVSPQTFVLVYEGCPPTQGLNRKLVDDVLQLGGAGALVEPAPGPHIFHIPRVPDSVLPIVEILPAQMISLALARLGNHIAGQFTHGSKITTTE